MFLRLAIKSLLDRKSAVVLSLLAMSVSIFVLLGVEHIRHQAKESFSNTVSGVDLIVGGRSGSLNLLLYSVFRMGSPTNSIRWESYEHFAAKPNVAWAIPLSLGDSHKGYRVVGTTKDYFDYFRYGGRRQLAFKEGVAFDNVFDVVLGADVARQLGYQIGDPVVLAHGVAATSFTQHSDRPFQVTGILAATGTPVDQSLHVSLRGIEAIHTTGIPISQFPDLKPKSITAFMLGLKSRIDVFRVQRDIQEYRQEPLLAILPGVALSELWQMMSAIENTLLLVSMLVFTAACLGMCAMLVASIRERRTEIQLLRVIGAPPSLLFLLIELEACLMTLCSVLLGGGLLVGGLVFAEDYLISQFGLHISTQIMTKNGAYLVSLMLCSTILVAAIPSFMVYRNAKGQRKYS